MRIPHVEELRFEDLHVGISKTREFVVDESCVNSFAEATGDYNPIHFSDDAARVQGYEFAIAHGVLSLGFVSEVIGMHLPGKGTILMEMHACFKRPVPVGSTVKVEIVVVGLQKCEGHLKEKGEVHLRATCFVKEKPVVEGKITILVPLRSDGQDMREPKS